MKSKAINYTICVPTTKAQKAQFQAYFKRNGLVAGQWVLTKLLSELELEQNNKDEATYIDRLNSFRKLKDSGETLTFVRYGIPHKVKLTKVTDEGELEMQGDGVTIKGLVKYGESK